eukprot:8305383-Pyramimonas_sp.AAC.1
MQRLLEEDPVLAIGSLYCLSGLIHHQIGSLLCSSGSIHHQIGSLGHRENIPALAAASFRHRRR